MKKIPLKYAPLIGCTAGHLRCVNLGRRQLSIDLAIKLHEVSRGSFPVLLTRPDLRRLCPFLHQKRGQGRAIQSPEPGYQGGNGSSSVVP
jgi:hypothetical protein